MLTFIMDDECVLRDFDVLDVLPSHNRNRLQPVPDFLIMVKSDSYLLQERLKVLYSNKSSFHIPNSLSRSPSYILESGHFVCTTIFVQYE